jgi:phage terminase small subunit
MHVMDVEALIEQEYKAGAGPKALSEKYGVKLDTIKSWIKRRGWKRGAPSNEGAPRSVERVHPEERGVSPPSVVDQPDERESEGAGLTPKQRLFVQEYLIDLNATQAAVRAGYSPKTAAEQGHQLLQKTSIREAVEGAMAERSQRLQITQDWVLMRLVRLADYNLRDFANLATVKRIFETKGGDVMEDEVQVVQLNEDFDGTIAKALSQDKDGIKLEMPDRLKALELIGKHIGLFGDPHKRRVDEERLKMEQQRLEIERDKAKQAGGGDGGDGVTLVDDIGEDEVDGADD